MRKNTIFGAVLAAVLAAGTLAGCGSSSNTASSTAASAANTASVITTAESAASSTAGDIPEATGKDTTIVVGASPSPHAEILEQAKKLLEAKGWTLDVKEYSDYIQPNAALASGDLDANYFQHKPYLDEYNSENGTDLVSAATIHYEPFGIFPGKTKSLDDLKDGATVGVPNDATNEARALNLLAANGLIKLKDGADINATVKDIEDNPKNLQIQEIEAAQLPRSLQDLDIAVINGNYAIDAGLSPTKDALALEDAESLGAKTYGNIIAVRKGDENTEKTKALVAALESDTVRNYINETYDGAVVPLF
ncbi:MAG: MetQ/NlpA family ABC transporter substrate-binding protein [Chordicoccus sp.]